MVVCLVFWVSCVPCGYCIELGSEYVCMYVCIYVCVRVFVCVCVCVWLACLVFYSVLVNTLCFRS